MVCNAKWWEVWNEERVYTRMGLATVCPSEKGVVGSAPSGFFPSDFYCVQKVYFALKTFASGKKSIKIS